MIRWEDVQELSDGPLKKLREEISCPHNAVVKTGGQIIHSGLLDDAEDLELCVCECVGGCL